MPAWVSSLFLRTFDQEITGSSGALGFQIHFVMSFVAPEMVVLSKVLLVVCLCMRAHSCGCLLYRREGLPRAQVGL